MAPKPKDQGFFVGRSAETAQFRQIVQHDGVPKGILNIYGPGGIGKTRLIDEFRRIAADSGAACLSLDSRDIPRPPNHKAQEILAHFASAGRQSRKLLTLDTYEEFVDLDRWLRDDFLPRLPSETIVVIAGRFPLPAAWHASPAWRQLISSVALSGLNRNLTGDYLRHCGIKDPDSIRQIWSFTRGHPLALSLMTALADEQPSPGVENGPNEAAYQELARFWIQEVPDDGLRSLVEAASIVRRFDQEVLSWLLEKPVTGLDFERLTALSFAQTSLRGWTLHDLVRLAFARDLRQRTPDRFRRLWERGLDWYRRKFASLPDPSERALAFSDFFHLLGDGLIRAALFSDPDDSRLYVEPASLDDIPPIIKYFSRQAADADLPNLDVQIDIVDHSSGSSYAHVVPAEHNRREAQLINPAKLLALGPETIRLCRDQEGHIRGVLVVIPVNCRTIDYLRTQPVSGPYFRRLTAKERAEYATPEEATKAWFIRLLDVSDPEDCAARSALLRDLLPLMVGCERLLASNPLPFYKKLLIRFGFKEVPGATHYDFGPQAPSPTYILDLRGSSRDEHLDRLIEQVGGNAAPSSPGGFMDLTPREREVAELVAIGRSNTEIAKTLFVTESTVKKHLTRVFEKLGVSSRTQLIRKIIGGQP